MQEGCFIKSKVIWLSLVLGALFVICLGLPTHSFADGDVVITVSDPERGDGQVNEGTTVNTILAVPTVTYGDNKEMGTLRITGKDGVAIPLKPGAKIMVTMQPGTCYMQVPTAENYQKYVEWPEFLDGEKNQIEDGGDEAGVKFVAGTPRSFIVEIGNINPDNRIMVLDFVFNQDNFSKVRVSRLLDIAKEYNEKPEDNLTRLEFFKDLADITVAFPSSPFKYVRDDQLLAERFTDAGGISASDANKIKPLADAGLIIGDQGLLKPGKLITRAEAAHLVGQLFPVQERIITYNDSLPAWATGINAAVSVGLIAGYPDNTFMPEQFITKEEAFNMLQKTLESYASLENEQ